MVANTGGVSDPQQSFITAGLHPRLNFYKPGGVDIEYVNMSSIVQAMQSLRSGHVDFGPAMPGILLPAMAKDPSLDDPDQRIGAMSLAEWQANIKMTAESTKNAKLADEIGDPNRLFTNELIDEVNAFDRNAVIEMAKNFKV
jgi:hypothetical protein